MSLCNNNILQINNNVNFSLIKRKKNRVFGTYKTLRYSKLSKPVQKNINKIDSNLNKWIISDEINLKYNSLPIKENYPDTKKNKSLSYDKIKEIKRNSIFKNKRQIKLKKNTSTFQKKNVLIKPILVEDDLFNNNINKPKNELFFFQNNNINDYKYYNYTNCYNNYYNINIYNKSLDNNILINKTGNNNNYCINYFPNEFWKNYNNKNITENIQSYSNSQDKMKQSAFSSNNFIFNNLRIPPNINSNCNYYPFYNNNSNQTNNSQLNETEQKKKNSKKIFEFKKEKKYRLLLEDKNSSSMASSTAVESLINNNEEKRKCNTNKGRKLKNSDLKYESKHTKYSSDNMMRKIKNKVIESSRLLSNKVIKEEFKEAQDNNFPFREFRKIQGAFSQELNIKYNFWFYQIKIKEIFCLEISNKYTAIQKSSNKRLIDYIYSNKNNDKFIKTKKLLDMPFHQYYHDIFLGEDENWKIVYGINDKDNIYEIKYLLKNLEEKTNDSKIDEKKYIEDINLLALNYEQFFLEKKPRNLDYKNKKNEFIKTFMINLLNDKYLKLAEEIKMLKEYYEKRKINNKIIEGEKSPLSIIGNEAKNNELNINKIDNEKINEDNNIINNIIKDNNNDNNLLDIYESNEKVKNYYNINRANIDLKEEEDEEEEEEKQENINGNTLSNKNQNKMNNYEREINHFFGIKKKHRKIRYFLSCKKTKNINNN